MKDKELLSLGFVKERIQKDLDRYVFKDGILVITYYKNIHRGYQGCEIQDGENFHSFDDDSYVDYTIRKFTKPTSNHGNTI